MNHHRPDGFTIIGLHKLAAQSGDGLVPELYELFQQHAERQQIYKNVMLFPTWEARMPGEATTRPLGPAAANGNNILAFPSHAARMGKRKA
ncbi:hypothetical protein [Rhizobium binae]|uniref:Uncharacterized protein n=1 Tax=Rhizobium binae TaxID=1138190 RepID=A0ABV2MPY3_9HYPH|nr:hypothetical protein [Rhizobium binae]NKL49808.1 hypothetical protein [Rhizobium leguminosarum bv. viciae]MBX4938748.1 hypothetical protein [Rhizobium binae]MBX4945375.1 hypothetical protein [Rhizobium binae]MBX4963604.1 hypothetical protein [Rhizobium binae]MBX4980779.1 hypothetical protein [Rhizobium binae]